jgi:hypothetical protein
MSVKEFVNELRLIIEDVKRSGSETVRCDALIHYLNDVGNSPGLEPSPTDLEQYKRIYKIGSSRTSSVTK